MKRRKLIIGSLGFAGSWASGITRAASQPCPPGTVSVSGGDTASTSCGGAEADWVARTSGPGVVWYHDFRSDAEVNNFRWTSGLGGGNDPNGVGTGAMLCRRITTDGVTGGGCLEQFRPAGSSESNGAWWRPFSPMTAPGNGKTTDDPGANGSISPKVWNPTSGGSQTSNWGVQGAYGHSSYQTTGWDGTEFYLQMRIKMDPRRISAGMPQVGKLTYMTNTYRSLSSQELVTFSGAIYSGRNMFRMYASGSPPLEVLDSLKRPGQQLGSDLGFCDVGSAPANCWSWSGGWDTVMYNLQPGRAGVQETRIRVYVAHEGVRTYSKIWDEVFAIGFEDFNGWNALLTSTYQNGFNCPSDFWHRYDQIIFSKEVIPCPQV